MRNGKHAGWNRFRFGTFHDTCVRKLCPAVADRSFELSGSEPGGTVRSGSRRGLQQTAQHDPAKYFPFAGGSPPGRDSGCSRAKALSGEIRTSFLLIRLQKTAHCARAETASRGKNWYCGCAGQRALLVVGCHACVSDAARASRSPGSIWFTPFQFRPVAAHCLQTNLSPLTICRCLSW